MTPHITAEPRAARASPTLSAPPGESSATASTPQPTTAPGPWDGRSPKPPAGSACAAAATTTRGSPRGARPPGRAAQEGMDAMSDLPPAQDPGADQKTETDAVLRAELPADLTSARQARAAIRQALAAWRMDHLSGDAELLASELVANAAEHGDGKPIGLALRRHAEPDGRPGITCEVTDTSPDHAPAPRNPARTPNAAGAWRSSPRWPTPAACAPARPARPAGSPSPSPTAPTGSPGRSTTSPKPAREPAPSKENTTMPHPANSPGRAGQSIRRRAQGAHRPGPRPRRRVHHPPGVPRFRPDRPRPGAARRRPRRAGHRTRRPARRPRVHPRRPRGRARLGPDRPGPRPGSRTATPTRPG